MSESTTISDNIRHLLTMHGSLSVSELARQTKIPQPTLHHLLNGVTKKPRQHVLERLAQFFSVSVPQLTGALPLDKMIPLALQHSLNITPIPIIDWEMVLTWPTTDVPRETLASLILDKRLGEHAFALRMNHAGLEPLFPDNAILIFDPAKIPEDRDFIIVHSSEQDSLLFNRLFVDGPAYFIKQTQGDGNMRLIKINTPTDTILGTLIEVRLQF